MARKAKDFKWLFDHIDELEKEDCDYCKPRKGRFKSQGSRRVAVPHEVDEKEERAFAAQQTTVEKESYDKEGFWEKEDPPDVIDLGRAGWTLLHTVASSYPENPSDEKKAQYGNFLRLFSEVYPCSFCSKDIQQYMAKEPPQLGSRRDLTQWTCRAHNHVNEQLNKPLFPCERVDERWGRQKQRDTDH